MDYEKKYNEALERIKKYYDMGSQPSHWDLGYIFPELREGKDERIRKSLIDYFKHYNPKDKWDDEFSFKDVLDYLEKQKEQKPAEWSEKDEKMREKLINFLGSPHVPLTYEEFSEYRSWLISLRPQPHWKPSEEQMKELKDASAVMKCDSDDSAFPLLKTLYEQLQKL